MDIYQRPKPPKGPLPYVRTGDTDLYSGLDSAIKAAAFWSEVPLWTSDELGNRGFRHAVVNVPVLVLSQPFWDVALDGGAAAEPVKRSAGYHLGWFAFPGLLERPAMHMQSVMSLIWSSDELPWLVRIMDSLVDWINAERLEL